ncbi:hypothetical protein Taro_014542, partial [Colocasia esculenta]|nr:hypothetical protein [Colocasia esculenta]
EETLHHLFVGCPYSQRIWREIARKTGSFITLQGDVPSLLKEWHRVKEWTVNLANVNVSLSPLLGVWEGRVPYTFLVLAFV